MVPEEVSVLVTVPAGTVRAEAPADMDPAAAEAPEAEEAADRNHRYYLRYI